MMPRPPAGGPAPGRRRLPLYTFLSVFGAIVLTGLLIVPALLRAVERQYLVLQADVNARQARALGQFVDRRLRQGAPKEQVLQEFQAMIANSDVDRGFSCMVDQATQSLISHPMQQALGTPVAGKRALFLDLEGARSSTSWERAMASGGERSGLLRYPDDRIEVVHMVSVPGTGWTINTHENTERVQHELGEARTLLIWGSLALGFLVAVPASVAARGVGRRYESRIEAQNELIRAEQERSETLLLNILPQAVAEKLKSGRGTIAERHAQVTVLFADLVGFTAFAGRIPAEELVEILNQVFSAFDDLCARHGLEKIKTIGDAYMACGGLRDEPPDSAACVAEMALDMLCALEEISRARGLQLALRIGIHSGAIVAGVIGKQKFSYDLWGDVVNAASRMESSGVAGAIQVTEEVRAKLADRYLFEERGIAEIKGKGPLRTYFLRGRAPGA